MSATEFLTIREKYLRRAAQDFEYARQQLALSECKQQNIDAVAAHMVLASRLEAVEDALVSGFPIAGEGI